jgi:hypothetical protein
MPELAYQLSPQETALLCGDLSKLTEAQRADLVMKVCESVGLNPYTRPLQYIEVYDKAKNAKKLILYATKDCTEQLRKTHGVSLTITNRSEIKDTYIVTAQAKDANGRVDESTGAVTIANLGGDNLCNALMKAETKAKRRVTLSICGLGILDESEIETIAGAQVLPPVALPAAVVAPPRGIDISAPSPVNELGALGKKLGKLAGAVNNDLQRLGGDVLALKAEYEKALADKNPRGASAPNAVAVEAKSADDTAAPIEPDKTTRPAVDGEAGAEVIEAPESEKLAAVMKVMTHAGFEREFPIYADKMKVCSEVTGRAITGWSQLEPEDCLAILAYLRATDEPESESTGLVALQIELKDARFVKWLKTSKTYKIAEEAGAAQADALRSARLAFASYHVKREIGSFKDLSVEECKLLQAKAQETKAK